VSGEITQTKAGRRVHAVLVAATVVMAVVAGVSVYQAVSGSDDKPPVVLPTGATTTTGTAAATTRVPSSSPTLKPPLLPAAAAKPTPDGAAEFFRFFWATYNYSFASLDAAPLRRISAPTCKSCAAYATGIDDAKRAGARFDGGRVIVRQAVAAPDDVQRGLVVNALVDQGAAVTIARDGQTSEPEPSKPDLRVDAAVRWTGEHWVMVGMDTGATS
jgi:hypothetical protein